jgi:arylsulfatase A-like enzyme
VGAYGDPLARTPNLDRLAAEGIVFDHVYSPAPVCAPCRSSLITGRYATSMGTQHMRSQRPLPPGVKFFPEYLRTAGYFTSNNAKTDYNTATNWAAVWNENGQTAHFQHRAAGQPFFAIFNFEQSHESHLHRREPFRTDPAQVHVPAYLPDTAETRADLAQYYDCVTRADAAIGKILAQLTTDGLADDTIVCYYSDHGGCVARSKRFLYENGTHPAMIMRFPKKFAHLAPATPGTHLSELVNLVDLAPTMLSLTGVPAPEHFQGRAFAGSARAPAPEFTYSFRDRMDERYDLSRAVTDGRYRYLRHYLPHRPLGQHIAYLYHQATMRKWDELYRADKLDATQRAFFEPKPAEELFDCSTDPDNIHNLAQDPAQRSNLARMRAANRAQLLRTRDTGFLPEAMMVALADGASPTTLTASEEKYPLGRLLDLLDSCQLENKAVEKIPSAAQDLLPVFRYWSATLSLALNQPLDLTALLSDANPSVRLAGAEATLRHASNDKAWSVIAESLTPAQSRELRLTAINALTYIPAAPASFTPLITACANTKEEYLQRSAEFLLQSHHPSEAAP